MKIQRIAVLVTIINLVIMIVILTQLRPANAQSSQQYALPVLRGRALEIVDSLGKIRASITIQPPVVVDGKKYPQTVLLRLIDTRGGPIVKLGAADNGSGLSLSNDADEGILMHARDSGSFIQLSHHGKEQVIKP
jgi:hypothetical protein